MMAFEPAEINFISEKMGRRKTVKKVAKVNTRNSNFSVHPTNDGEEEEELGRCSARNKGLVGYHAPGAKRVRSHFRGEFCGQRENSHFTCQREHWTCTRRPLVPQGILRAQRAGGGRGGELAKRAK